MLTFNLQIAEAAFWSDIPYHEKKSPSPKNLGGKNPESRGFFRKSPIQGIPIPKLKISNPRGKNPQILENLQSPGIFDIAPKKSHPKATSVQIDFILHNFHYYFQFCFFGQSDEMQSVNLTFLTLTNLKVISNNLLRCQIL